MKILVSIILCLWLTLTTGLSQSFPNIDLAGQTCAASINFPCKDCFAYQANDGCSTTPWFVSHGTPDILPNGFIQMGSGVDEDFGFLSEGISYKQIFIKNKLYILTLTLTTNVNDVNIFLANNVPIALDKNTPFDITRRSFKIPNVTDKQLLLNQKNTSNITKTMTIGFIPTKDYDCLWIFAEDNRSVTEGGLNLASFKINTLICDVEPIKVITATKSNFDYGPRVSAVPFHVTLPPQLTATDKINIIPRSFVEVFTNQTSMLLINHDPKVNLLAGNSISIKPDKTQSRSVFWAGFGSVFTAKISKSIGCEEACDGFIRWEDIDKDNFARYISTKGIDKCSTVPQNTQVSFVTNFPKPYNAYRVEMRVYKPSIGNTLPLIFFQQVWEDPLKRALPEGVVVWKPTLKFPNGSYIADGVYPIEIRMTNCYGTYIYKRGRVNADPSPPLPDVTIACGILPFAPDSTATNLNLSIAINSNLGTTKNDMKKEISVNVFPNPTNGKITIISNANIEKSDIEITNILGKAMATFSNDNISMNSAVEYDISNFPTGVYIVSIMSNNKIISRTKISKL